MKAGYIAREQHLSDTAVQVVHGVILVVLLLEKVVQVVLFLERGVGTLPVKAVQAGNTDESSIYIYMLFLYQCICMQLSIYMVMVDSCCYVEVKAIFMSVD